MLALQGRTIITWVVLAGIRTNLGSGLSIGEDQEQSWTLSPRYKQAKYSPDLMGKNVCTKQET